MAEENNNSGFFKMLTRDNSAIKQDRARRLEKITKSQMDNAIASIENEIMLLEDELSSQMDVSISNNANTINRIEDWDGQGFVEKRIRLKVKIRNLNINLKAAKEVKEELFG